VVLWYDSGFSHGWNSREITHTRGSAEGTRKIDLSILTGGPVVENRDMSFQLNFKTTASLKEIEKWFREEWHDLGIRWADIFCQGEDEDNWIEVKNYYKGFPEFSHYILATSKPGPTTEPRLTRQIELARLLMSRLQEKGAIVEYNGDFEDLL
jgi:hypothetical protein